jgi:hypothetical protein
VSTLCRAGQCESTTNFVYCAVSDLALCVPFDGDVVDASSSKLAPIADKVTFVEGRHGLAVKLDGSSSVRLQGPTPALDATRVTVEAWVRLAANRTESAFVVHADDRYALAVLPDGRVRCNTGSGSEVVTAEKIPPDEWRHIACTIGAAMINVYVQGQLRANGSGSTSASSNRSVAIGATTQGGGRFVGEIDLLRVTRTVRTAQQIAEAAAGNGILVVQAP